MILCKALPGNVGGWNFEWGGYNCTFVEIGGNDAYLQHLFVHETGHAIIRSLSHTDPGQSFLAEWTALTPEDVLEAVEKGTADGKNAITVEFTPDDKSGNVCYVSPYAMKNPEEDRAETLAAFYSGPFAGTDENLFTENCPVLRAKAAFWGTMIRRAFQLADSVALPLDSIE